MNLYEADPDDTIRLWMKHVLATGGIDRFDDLHIDQITSEWSKRSQWIAGMISSLKSARLLGLEAAPGKVVALMCSLTDGSVACPQNLREVAAQLDWAPPSLYLFNAGKEAWADSLSGEIKSLPLEDFSELEASKIFLYEWHREEALRRTFIAV